MAFFRTFLMENNQTPDTAFDEEDEAALVIFLLQARVKGSAADLQLPPGFRAPEHLPGEFDSPGVRQELKFIAGFLCFFVSKPVAYMREIKAFRDYFIPRFASDIPKQIQLAQALREEFFSATLDDLRFTDTVDRFFDIAEISLTA
ncbi:hypothetical protein [Acidipila rosea]|uniref:Uncharacterized protein n=1 Tax=Acidipila rosea TaxID=768535 RepID=A0A4R1LCN5_9BACT|nr:hypothetical protein [Acidipila rosea]TCK75397.1 hypothetical protein C7378_0380 [Acidipila rosea]